MSKMRELRLRYRHRRIARHHEASSTLPAADPIPHRTDKKSKPPNARNMTSPRSPTREAGRDDEAKRGEMIGRSGQAEKRGSMIDG